MQTIKCPNCGEIILAADDIEIIKCTCGKRYKNPYYYGNKNANSEEQLSGLLALRTSIFGVNQIADKLNNTKQGIDNCESKNDNETTRLQQESERLKSQKVSDNMAVENYLSEKSAAAEQNYDYMKKRHKSVRGSFRDISLWVIIALSFIIWWLSAILAWTGATKYPFSFIDPDLKPISEIKSTDYSNNSQQYYDDYVAAILSGIFLGLAVGVLSLAGLFVARICITAAIDASYNSKETDLKNSVKRYKQSKKFREDMQILIAKNKNRNQYLDSQIVIIEKQIADKNTASKSKIALYESDIKIFSKIIERDLSFLNDKYGAFLHESDWEHLDYIIYLFATRRADSMKEALHLLDEQKRTEMIVKAVENSSRYLAQNISNAINSLGQTLVSKLSEIDKSLSSIRSSIIDAAGQAHNDRIALGKIALNTQMLMSSFAVQSNVMMANIAGTLNRNSKY